MTNNENMTTKEGLIKVLELIASNAQEEVDYYDDKPAMSLLSMTESFRRQAAMSRELALALANALEIIL